MWGWLQGGRSRGLGDRELGTCGRVGYLGYLTKVGDIAKGITRPARPAPALDDPQPGHMHRSTSTRTISAQIALDPMYYYTRTSRVLYYVRVG